MSHVHSSPDMNRLAGCPAAGGTHGTANTAGLERQNLCKSQIGCELKI